jgi:hypothetical protein
MIEDEIESGHFDVPGSISITFAVQHTSERVLVVAVVLGSDDDENESVTL